ncbi:MAG: ParB N-terminal domain-containing protein [Spirochaetota bacterium]
MKVRISEIKQGKRIRKEIGDIEGLKESMNHIGLLHPIILDLDYNLIAGSRRLEAAKALHWDSIEAKLVDTKDKKTKLMIELQENNTRVDFTPLEIKNSQEILRIHSQKNVLTKLALWLKDKLSR